MNVEKEFGNENKGRDDAYRDLPAHAIESLLH